MLKDNNQRFHVKSSRLSSAHYSRPDTSQFITELKHVSTQLIQSSPEAFFPHSQVNTQAGFNNI